MEFTIIHRGDGMWEVHRTGCQDIAKTMRSANGAITRHADNVDAAIHDDLHVDNGGELADLGYDEGYYHVKPCAHTGAGK